MTAENKVRWDLSFHDLNILKGALQEAVFILVAGNGSPNELIKQYQKRLDKVTQLLGYFGDDE